MARLDNQMTLSDVDPEYQGFVDKFKPKKTTDDCYTPPNIYAVVLKWVIDTYGIDPEKIVRPFWPGGDYMNEEYPDGCTVVDNPPFSIITEIVNNYNAAGIKYFLFAPYLTNFTAREKASHIITGSNITYENGADVPTSFLTNLDRYFLRSCPDLAKQIEEANKANIARVRKQVPKYKYPHYVITAADLGYLAKWGVDLRIMAKDCFFIRALEEQKSHGKAIFGSGFLLSEKAVAEKAAAEKVAAEKAAAEKASAKEWKLSENEKRIIASLGGQDPD